MHLQKTKETDSPKNNKFANKETKIHDIIIINTIENVF